MACTYNEIVLAAWLHSIGIFTKRAGIGSGDFFLQTVKSCLPGDVQADEVVRLAKAWRSPAAYNEWIIAHADRLSRGADDFKRGDETEFNEPLVHLVSTVQIREEAPRKGYCLLKPLEGRAIFPSTEAKTGGQEYRKLWNDFEKDFHALKSLKYPDFMASLDTLLEREE